MLGKMPGSEARGSASSHGRDRLLIDRFAERIEGFNVRSLTLGDLSRLCDERHIELVQTRMRSYHGVALEDDGYSYIYINSLLSEPERIIAGYHEYCHIADHCLDMSIRKSTGSFWNLTKYERQAQVIGTVALMPESWIRGLSVEGIGREFGVSRGIAEFRASLRVIPPNALKSFGSEFQPV
jgi:Zn-dependent peptidase ImmA (M78 family)